MPPRNSTTTLTSSITSPSTSFTNTVITTATSIFTTMMENTTIYNQTTGMPISTTTQRDDCNKIYLLAGLVTGASCMAVICMTGYCLYRKTQRCISSRIKSNEQKVNQIVALSNNNSILDRHNSDQDLISI